VAGDQHSHFYGRLSLKDPAEPALTGGLDHFTLCVSRNGVTKLLGAGEGGKRAEESRTEAGERCWLVFDLQPPRRGDAPCAVHTAVGAACQGDLQESPEPRLCWPHAPPPQPVGCSCNERLTQPFAGSHPPLPWLHADTTPTKPVSPPALSKRAATFLHAVGAQPEQDRGGKGKNRQPRACLEESTPRAPRKPKLPEQSPRRTHLHIGVTCPVLLSYQTFCFHDWKRSETVKPQSGREGILLHHKVPRPRRAEPISNPARIQRTSPRQPGLTGHPPPGEGVNDIFFFNTTML